VIRFCPRCAAALPGEPPVACTSCGYELFLNARPTASVIVLDGDRFLGLLRSREPQIGEWETPGGFCDGWEHPSAAALREAREELGVEVRLDEFVGMYVGSYAFQGELLPVLDCFWTASITSGEIVLDPAESSAYRWFDLADPPRLAFATMDAAIGDLALRRSANAFGAGERRA
jgi:8-oxo-dGTP diphosphatase